MFWLPYVVNLFVSFISDYIHGFKHLNYMLVSCFTDSHANAYVSKNFVVPEEFRKEMVN